jgi:hypothetical protein
MRAGPKAETQKTRKADYSRQCGWICVRFVRIGSTASAEMTDGSALPNARLLVLRALGR